MAQHFIPFHSFGLSVGLKTVWFVSFKTRERKYGTWEEGNFWQGIGHLWTRTLSALQKRVGLGKGERDFKLSWILGWKYCSGKYELSENHTKSNPLRPKIFMCLASSCPSLTVAAQSETHSLFFIYFLKYTWCSFWSLRMRLFSLILPKPLLRFVIGSLSISHYFL